MTILHGMGIAERLVRAVRAPELTAAISPVSPVAPTSAASVTRQPLTFGSPWADPDHLAFVDYAAVRGATGADGPVTRDEAMSVPAMSRARDVICGTVSGITLTAYRGQRADPSSWQRVEPQPAWIGRTDAALPPMIRMIWTADDVLFTGFSLWALTRAADGRTVVNADRVARHRWDFDADSGALLIDGKSAAAAGYPDLLLIIGPGEGLLKTGRRAIRHASRVMAGAERAAKNPVPVVELHQITDDELSDAEIAAFKASWRASLAEDGLGFTNSALEVKTHGQTDGTFLIEARNAAAVDVARASNLPASALDAHGGNSLTYQTARDNARAVIDQGVGLILGAISASLSQNTMTPAGTFVVFDLEAWLNANNPAPLSVDPTRNSNTGSTTEPAPTDGTPTA